MGFWATVGTAVVTAFISGVVFQYAFMPWLEARKNILLQQSEQAHQLAGKLRQAEALLFELTHHMGGPEVNYVGARARLRLEMFKLELTQSYVELALPLRYKFPVGGVVADVDNILSIYRPEYGYLGEARKGVLTAATMISPTTPPFAREWHLFLLRRLHRKTRDLRRSAREDSLTRGVETSQLLSYGPEPHTLNACPRDAEHAVIAALGDGGLLHLLVH